MSLFLVMVRISLMGSPFHSRGVTVGWRELEQSLGRGWYYNCTTPPIDEKGDQAKKVQN